MWFKQNQIKSNAISKSRERSRKLRDKMLEAEIIKSKWTILRISIYAIACFPWLGIIGFIAGSSIMMLVSHIPYFVVAFGLSFVDLFYLLNCEMCYSRLKFRANAIARGNPKYANLFACLDKATQASQTPKIDLVLLTGKINAEAQQVGWRKRRILHLGLPIFYAPTPQPFIGIVAHEIGHYKNKDCNRLSVINPALSSLVALIKDLETKIVPPSEFRRTDFASFITNLFPDLVSILAYFLINLIRLILKELLNMVHQLLWHLCMLDSQRAEYQADAVGASIAGTDIMKAGLNFLYFKEPFQELVQEVVWGQARFDLFKAFEGQVAQLDEQEELRRVKRVKRRELKNAPETHPPTSYRLEVLEAHYVEQAPLKITEDEFEQIKSSLKPFEGIVQELLINEIHEAANKYKHILDKPNCSVLQPNFGQD